MKFEILCKEKVEDIKSNMEMLDDIFVENLKSQYEKKLVELKSKKAQFIKRREYLVKLETDSQGFMDRIHGPNFKRPIIYNRNPG